MFAIDNSNKANIDDYKITCIQFIEDISNDYKNWVNRYNLSKEEHDFRIGMIDFIVKNTNLWIAKYGNIIKKIDIIKDDGLSKMAGFTAGYPFKFHMYINNQELYATHNAGKIKLNIVAEASKDDRKVRVTNLGNEFIGILASTNVRLEYPVFNAAKVINDNIILDATTAKPSDIISITVAIEELYNDLQINKRGLSIIIRIS